MSKKKLAVTLGVWIGMSASIAAMLPHSSEAAIAVWDEKNIAQAIEMVTKTTQILSDEDKRLLLAIINAKKLDADMIQSYLKDVAKSQQDHGLLGNISLATDGGGMTMSDIDKLYQEAKRQNGGQSAAFDGAAYVEKAWVERLGDLQRVLNGNITLADAAIHETAREKALNDAFLEAAMTAQQTQQGNLDIQEQTNQLLEQSMNAEGETQILQAGNALAAQNVMATLLMSRQIARGVQAEAAYYQSKNMEKAERLANNKKVRQKAAEAIGASAGEQ